MASAWPIVRRILWPERASLFVIVGGAIGLAGDITGFLSEFISPLALTGIFAGLSLISALLCLQRAFLVDPANSAAVDAVIGCRTCDMMRFSLFAFAAFILLLCVGQGKSATETIGETLGLIKADVGQVKEDVGQIKSDVGDIHSVTQSQQIIAKPKTAEDYFRNAWIYSNIQRDPAKAHESLEGLYQKFSGKLDSAELFFDTGRQIKGKNELLATMEDYGAKNNDPALLVVAARNANDPAESKRLAAKAQEIDPSYPFAYWDMQRFTMLATQTAPTPEAQMAMLEAQAAGLEKFIPLIGEKPAGAFFYLPQYQPDYESLARQNLAGYQKTLQSYRASKQRMEDAMRKRQEMLGR